MDEFVNSQNQVPYYVVEDIIRDDSELILGGGGKYDYLTTRVFTNNILRELNGSYIEVEQDVVHADVLVTRREDGHQTRNEALFMRLGNDLVPLGTHTNKNGGDRVYTLDEGWDQVALVTPLNQYVVDRLPDEVTLTRVLSEEEANKFASGSTDLGSTQPMFWQNAVHTALHNVTNEFEGSEYYPKKVGIVMTRDELEALMKDGSASVGTYTFAFKDHDPLSPFPFDVEVVFDAEAIPELLSGYAKWAQRQGVAYEDNPFYQPS